MLSSNSNLAGRDAGLQICHFMRLPIELRQMIYRPLLIAKYTMREHKMRSEEYHHWRIYKRNDHDQTYTFDTAIMATNRRIHEEATELCQRENDFVCLTSQQPSRLGCDLERCGLQLITKCSRARHFWNVSMSLTLDPPLMSGRESEDVSEDEPPWRYIFDSAEIPEFCRLLLANGRDGTLRAISLFIDVNPALGNEQAAEIDTCPAGQARMQKLFNPLRHLHSLGAVQIDGPLSGKFKGNLIETLCRSPPTGMDVIDEAMIHLDQADEKVKKGQWRDANLGYKAALSLVRPYTWVYREHIFPMHNGPFPGLEPSQTIKNIAVRLHARIAGLYLKNGQLRMARIYTDRALDPRRDYDRELPLQGIQPWEEIVYAEVLQVAAQISYAHGDVDAAYHNMIVAAEFGPLNEEQSFRYETLKAHYNRLGARMTPRYEAKKKMREKQKGKTEVLLGIADSQMKKGDRLLRGGRSILAASAYEKSLKNLELLKCKRRVNFFISAGTFEGHYAEDAVMALKFKVQAGCAAAGLMSRKYKEVVQLTESMWNFDCASTHNIELRCYEYYDLISWTVPNRLHYCRSQSLYHMGDTERAVEHMEKALSFDPGDGTAFTQLTHMRQRLAEEAEVKRKERREKLKKLNRGQNLLRKKQASRRAKTRKIEKTEF